MKARPVHRQNRAPINLNACLLSRSPKPHTFIIFERSSEMSRGFIRALLQDASHVPKSPPKDFLTMICRRQAHADKISTKLGNGRRQEPSQQLQIKDSRCARHKPDGMDRTPRHPYQAKSRRPSKYSKGLRGIGYRTKTWFVVRYLDVLFHILALH